MHISTANISDIEAGGVVIIVAGGVVIITAAGGVVIMTAITLEVLWVIVNGVYLTLTSSTGQR